MFFFITKLYLRKAQQSASIDRRSSRDSSTAPARSICQTAKTAAEPASLDNSMFTSSVVSALLNDVSVALRERYAEVVASMELICFVPSKVSNILLSLEERTAINMIVDSGSSDHYLDNQQKWNLKQDEQRPDRTGHTSDNNHCGQTRGVVGRLLEDSSTSTL